MEYERHYKECISLAAPAKELFAYLDNHANLTLHMNKPTWIMGGGRVDTIVEGRHIRMSGKAFGMSINLDEVVTQRKSPKLKVWETVGEPKLIVIGRYQMKFEITDSSFCVSIDYNLPKKNKWLGWLFSGYYAKWCVQQMTKGAIKYFQ